MTEGRAEYAAAICVNGVEVDAARFASAKAAAARELVRQRAVVTGLLGADAADDDIDAAIERLLEREVRTPEPTEAECRQYYDANPKRFVSGELVAARHILFQVTPACRSTRFAPGPS